MAVPFDVLLKAEPTPELETTMRFMVIVKASRESEANVMPDPKLFAEMGKYNEELAKAGVMLAGEGLRPSSAGTRIQYSGTSGRKVIDGPFSETKELVAGFWLLQARSRDEVVALLKRAPFQEGEVEIREIQEIEDFAAIDPTGELRKRETELRAKIAR